MFITGGWDNLRNPGGKVKKAEPVALPIAEKVPFLPQDAEKLVQLNGAVMLAGGTLLAFGKFRRLAALALIGSILPTTYAGHRFWEEEDEATRAQQRVHFLKNLGLLGGLILAAVDTEGAPSLAWRVTHRRGRKNTSGGSGLSGVSGVELAKHIGEGIAAAEEAISAAARAGGPVIEQAQATAHEAADRLSASSRSAIKHAQKATAEIDVARQMAALKEAQKAVANAAGTYRSALTRAEKKAAKVDLKKQVADLKKRAAVVKDARKAVRKTVKQGKATAKQTKAKAQPLVSTAASRASQAWSHLPVSA